jgi:hypothetical protein
MSPTPGIAKVPISKHHSQLELHLRQLPVPNVPSQFNISYLTNVNALISQFRSSVRVCHRFVAEP